MSGKKVKGIKKLNQEVFTARKNKLTNKGEFYDEY